jgi:predicted dinucleotide-binding enzyme/quinol monooxygenase YgiN
MKVGIIGAGNVGVGIGKHLAANGHDVAVSFSRTADNVSAAADAIGGGATAASPREAASHGDVVVIATPWAVTLDLVRELADALAGKVVWDATNAPRSDMSGLELGTTTSGGEEIAKAAPRAKVVKAVPPFADVLQSASTLIEGRKPGVFVCGDDAEARATVLNLVADIDAAGVDAGPLSHARYTEPLGMLLAQLAYRQGMGTHIGAVLIREADIAVEYIRYRIPEDSTDAFAEAYRAAVVPLDVSEYCLGYDLSHCAEDPELFMLRIRWTSIDDHLQKFRSSEEFRQFFSHIGPFVGQIEEMQHYNVTLAR